MDWAEELKMSIRKTTARKGRRSKSRDVRESTNGIGSSDPTAKNKEISIDITLDMQQSRESTSFGDATTTTLTPPSSSLLEDEIKPRRIAGGWAGESIGLKSSKTKKNSFEDDRFHRSTVRTPPDDDIPIIPDLDDVRDEMLMNEIAEPPSVSVNRTVTLKELTSDLLSQNAFSGIEDVDLSILTKCLQPQESLDEADEVWEWEKLFTDVLAEINSDKTGAVDNRKLEIGPDEVPPVMHV